MQKESKGLLTRPISTILASLSAALLFCADPAFSQEVSSDNPAVQAPQDALYEGSYADLAMGTLVSLRVYAADESTVDKAIEGFQNGISKYASLFTVHDEGSLNEVNRRAGQWVEVDCRVASLVDQSKRLAEMTDSAFEPTIGTLVNVWKIGFGGEAHPKNEDIRKALKKVDYRKIQTEIRPQACRVKIAAGQSIDLGAIAKGWIGTRLTDDLARLGVRHAVVDLGGNVALVGKSPAGRAWRVGVQRPGCERGTTMAVVEAENESVITSGAYERNIEANGKKYGHILSAKTGEPVATDIGSVTIVSADGAVADGWCTALFAMGTKKAVDTLRKRPGLKAFIVDDQLKRAWVSRNLAQKVTLSDKSITITIVQ